MLPLPVIELYTVDVQAVLGANTTEDALAVLDRAGLKGIVCQRLAERASLRAQRYLFQKMQVGTVMVAMSGELLGMDEMSAKVEGGVEINSGIVLQKTGDNEWRVAMTKFRFDPNEATFKQLNAEQKKDLDDTISHLVDKFKKISGAKITVEGYANNLSGTKEENENELIPLSEKRAQAIMELIAERGIPRESLDAKGMGDANPIASREDRANWWKNRRIEFLIKK